MFYFENHLPEFIWLEFPFVTFASYAISKSSGSNQIGEIQMPKFKMKNSNFFKHFATNDKQASLKG